MLTSSRRGIVYPNPNRSDSADVPRDIGALITASEAEVVYGQGTLAARPAFGLQGRIYQATDQVPKQFYWDNGAGWDSIGAVPYSNFNQIGLLTNRPAASAVQSGTRYFATDQVVQYVSDAVNWIREGDPAGVTCDWFNNAVPAGWVAYDASNLPASTGIYADLYAHLGSVLATPDTRARVTVPKGTHIDHDTLLKNDGLAVGVRRVKHKHTLSGAPGHTLTLPDHTHNYGSFGTGGNNTGGGDAKAPTTAATAGVNSFPAINGGITLGTLAVGPQTGSEPTDGEAYITCAFKIAKL